jgi:hypothetical protein
VRSLSFTTILILSLSVLLLNPPIRPSPLFVSLLTTRTRHSSHNTQQDTAICVGYHLRVTSPPIVSCRTTTVACRLTPPAPPSAPATICPCSCQPSSQTMMFTRSLLVATLAVVATAFNPMMPVGFLGRVCLFVVVCDSLWIMHRLRLPRFL